MRKPNGYWTYERCFQEAQKYTKLEEFDKNSHGACNSARRKGWLADYTWLKRGNSSVSHRKSKPDGYWNYANCYREARKYTMRAEFKRNSSSAYNVARQKGWLDSFDWMRRASHANWTYEDCLEESKKYESRSKFYYGCRSAYQASRRNDWLKDFTWLKNEHILSDQVDCVYGYFFENNVVYIGRTLMRCQNKRHQQHQVSSKDTVFVYAKKHDVEVPEMTILEDNLTLKEGCVREGYWVDYYKRINYTVLNRAKTGGIGAIGAGTWTKKRCLEEALKYSSCKDFNKYSNSAYSAAYRNGWLKDYKWLIQTRNPPKYWDYDRCYNEARKYNSIYIFIKSCGVAYSVARKKGWLKDYDWFVPGKKQNGYWNYDTCYQEAKKYKSRTCFCKGSAGAYNVARENGWLDAYNWFEIKSGIWTYDTCYELALICNTRSEFKNKSQSAYEVARKNNWLNEYTWFVDGHKNYGDKKRIWTFDSCYDEAKKYSTKVEFQRNSAGAYNVARKNNWLKHYDWFEDGRKIHGEKKRIWNRDTCYMEASKYTTKSDFRYYSSSAYTAALKNKWIKDYTWFENGRKITAEKLRKWNKDSCYKLALECHTRGELKKRNNAAYNVARKNGWLDDYTWMQRKYKSGKSKDKAQLELDFG